MGTEPLLIIVMNVYANRCIVLYSFPESENGGALKTCVADLIEFEV